MPAEEAFDYLVDPVNRPAWQSSLARVVDVSGPVTLGQSWTDVTVPGLRPRMTTTELDRPHRWTERGTWRRFAATGTLTFTSLPDGGCEVSAAVELSGPGAVLLRATAPLAVRRDLLRAARILSGPAIA